MDAVIFAGSGNRPARNHAEVTMTIDNADRTAPAGVNDRELLEISGGSSARAGSVYRINGRDVRARDVQILFADAATGARSPALVHQGKIGEIIQAKPEQRRRVLEDAAGGRRASCPPPRSGTPAEGGRDQPHPRRRRRLGSSRDRSKA